MRSGTYTNNSGVEIPVMDYLVWTMLSFKKSIANMWQLDHE